MTEYVDPHARPKRDLVQAMMRGLKGRCPACGEGKLFRAFLKVNNHCPHCREALYHQRADDLPAYLTIVVVGHIVVPAMLYVEKAYAPALWLHAAIWLPMTVILSLLFIQPIKGATVGMQWAAYMHGFDPHSPDAKLGEDRS